MESEQWPTDEAPPVPAKSPNDTSRTRLWLKRAGIGLVAVVSILIPLLIGLMYYLAVTDGLVINSGDPLHEVRLWMVQERKGATGLGLTVTQPVGSSRSDAVCAHTSVTFLRWDRSLSLQPEAGYCRCYIRRNGQLTDTDHAACLQG